MSKAKKLLEMLEDFKMRSTDFEAFRKNVKKVKLRDGKWYVVKGVVADQGIDLVGHDRVRPDEIVARM